MVEASGEGCHVDLEFSTEQAKSSYSIYQIRPLIWGHPKNAFLSELRNDLPDQQPVVTTVITGGAPISASA